MRRGEGLRFSRGGRGERVVPVSEFSFYKGLARPVFFQMDPERMHHVAMAGMEMLAKVPWRPEQPAGLEREVFGLRFPNPVGLAAGFDKNAVALRAWEMLGFGFVEAGTITAHAQPGNPRPRIFRLPEHGGLINRLGFNNEGAERVAARLARLRAAGGWPRIPVGLNIGKSKVTPLEEAARDYLFSLGKLYAHGDYFVLNVSSPNTPGLRALQGKEALAQLLGAVQRRNRELSGGGAAKPVLLKVAPDLDWGQLEEVIGLVEEHGLAGLVATNTTLDKTAIPEELRQDGGLSGRPLRAKATEMVRFITARTRKPVIAAGGVMDAEAALEKLEAGAALVQVYTGFVYEGPGLIREICEAVREREGFATRG